MHSIISYWRPASAKQAYAAAAATARGQSTLDGLLRSSGITTQGTQGTLFIISYHTLQGFSILLHFIYDLIDQSQYTIPFQKKQCTRHHEKWWRRTYWPYSKYNGKALIGCFSSCDKLTETPADDNYFKPHCSTRGGTKRMCSLMAARRTSQPAIHITI